MEWVFIISILLAIVSVYVAVSQSKKREELQSRFESYGIKDIDDAKNKLYELHDAFERQKLDRKSELAVLDNNILEKKKHLEELNGELSDLEPRIDSMEKKLENQKARFKKSQDLYSAMSKAIEEYYDAPLTEWHMLSEEETADLENVSPTVLLSLNCMNYKDLRKEFTNNQKQIEELLDQFKEHYTTKSNRAIYQLMTIALMAELQNILTALKYGKLEEKMQDVRTLVGRFISIAEEGNQTIASTVKKFAYALQNLFENAVKIEYEYYIKKEQARQEQLELKARMKEEREEQRRLAEQAAQFAKEQEKYLQEKERLQSKLDAATEDEKATIASAIERLDEQLQNIEEQKEEIAKLQHGKAGNVYIISNIGSFGEDVFKIGMTRRLDPQERVDELGSASVPFNFDVHSFIFSDDAVGLETELHHRLDDKRVNKVNQRKEFFRVSIDELENLVNEIYPSAEFNRTAFAEQYRQSLSLDKNDFGDYVEVPEEE